MKLSNKIIIALALLPLSIALPSLAQAEDAQVFAQVSVPSEQNIVRFFFLFSCPHCRDADAPMTQWASSVPKPITYIRTPVVVNSQDSMLGAVAYYSALTTDPQKINLYMSILFNLIHGQGYSAYSKSTYFQAAKLTKFDMSQFSKNWASKQVKELFFNAAHLTQQYNIKRTPTLTIGGRYSIDPEVLTGGSSEFINLANVMVSKYIQEQK